MTAPNGAEAEHLDGGLYDGFDAYRTPTSADYSRLLTSGLVVPDTNVLLNLYRYRNETRGDLFSVLDALRGQLWVPHQVMTEFWRNRETVLLDPRDTKETIEALVKYSEESIRVLRGWANRVSLPGDQKDEVLSTLSVAYRSVIAGVSEPGADDEDSVQGWETHADPVLGRLEHILRGRVGRKLDSDEHDAAVKEADRRRQSKQPPGYKDTGPGDYLVWVQILRESARRRKDVLLVTGDVKEDWWRQEHGQLRGPRPELVEELQNEAGVRLFMLRPESLLLHAREALSIDVRDASVEDIERVERLVSEEEPSGGWSVDSLNHLLDILSEEGWDAQELTILHAAKNGGFIDRDSVYGLANYDNERSLRGFTRPIRRITQYLKSNNVIPASATDVLTASYDSADGPPGWATGFIVPKQLVWMLCEVADKYYDLDDETAANDDSEELA